MITVTGVYRRGKVVLDSPVNWRDGSRVTVKPKAKTLGLNETDWPDSPQTRAELLRRFEALEPFEFTEDDRAAIEVAREAVREATLRSVRKQMGLDP